MATHPERITLHSQRSIPTNATALGRTDPEKQVSISIIVRRKNPLDLASLGGRVLSEEEFAQQYGADPAAFQNIRSFAKKHGLTVDEKESSLSRRTIVLHGPVKAMEEAFGVELHDYQGEQGRRFHVPHGAVTLSKDHSEIAGQIEAVLGLDARPLAKPHFRYLRDQKSPAAAPRAGGQGFTPPQVAALYNFPSDATGAGQTIGLLELGGGYNDSDLSTYFRQLGVTAPVVVSVPVDGGSNSPGDPNGADGEVALDIQVAGSIATGARIAVYFAPNTDQGFQDALTTAIHDQTNKPGIISISWGGPESSWSTQAMQAFDSACQSAAALGVTILAASGDNGSSDGVSDGQDHVDFPASSPHVLGCGGTQLNAQGTTRESEVVWNDLSAGGGATGGGVSNIFDVPTWQQGVSLPPPTANSGGRGVPDIAGNAAPSTGYQILVDGQSQIVGGTSAVAPLWAALIALLNQKLGRQLGWLNPTLYQNAQAFIDVSQGNNGDYTAGSGWDACTGLGFPDGQKLLQALSSTSTGSQATAA